MVLCISKNYDTDDFPEYPNLTLEHKIDIFEDRVLGWHLEIAEYMIIINEDKICNRYSKIMQHNGFAVLSVIFNYFEMIAKYKDPNIKGSKRLFRLGFEDVYPKYKNTECAKIIYKEGRNAMYHAGITGKGITICGGFKKSIEYNDNNKQIGINPHIMVRELKKHFLMYISKLRKSKPGNSIIKKFEKAFSKF